MCTDHVHCTSTLAISTHQQNFPYLAFLAPFWSLASSVSPVTGLWGPCSGRSYIISILLLLIFLHFLIIFASITILGNVHRPCTLYLNISNKYTSCLLSFSWLFADFFIIFALITILGSAHRPCKQYSNINTTIHIFLLILSLFFKWKCKTFHIWHFLAPFWSLDSSVILVTWPHQQYHYISMIV